MLLALDINQRIEFISKFDISEPKTVFVLRPLSGLEMMQFSDGKIDDIKKMILMSIVEVKNYNIDGIENVLNSLPLNYLGELINKINEINKLTGQDAKN